MSLNELAGMFNRAWEKTFSVRKFFYLFLALVLSGLLFLFFQGMANYASVWLQIALRFIPLILSMTLIMAAGVLLIRGHSDENSLPIYNKAFQQASYFALPLLGAFIALWILLGAFLLLKAVPYIGVFFSIVLAFVPFLLTLSMLLLFVAALGILFFFTPDLAIQGKAETKDFATRLRSNLFVHVVCLLVALFPVWITWIFLTKAAAFTFDVYSIDQNPLVTSLQGFFILIPFAVILSFPLIFFFNFALETYQLVADKKPQEGSVSF